MDPVLNEICRIPRSAAIREDVLRRWQRYLRTVVQPQLDELAQLKATAVTPDATTVTNRRRPA